MVCDSLVMDKIKWVGKILSVLLFFVIPLANFKFTINLKCVQTNWLMSPICWHLCPSLCIPIQSLSYTTVIYLSKFESKLFVGRLQYFSMDLLSISCIHHNHRQSNRFNASIDHDSILFEQWKYLKLGKKIVSRNFQLIVPVIENKIKNPSKKMKLFSVRVLFSYRSMVVYTSIALKIK